MKNKERIELLVKLLVKNDDIKTCLEYFAKDGIITTNEESEIQEKPEHEKQQKLIETLKSKVDDTNPADANLVKIIAYFKGILYPEKETLDEKVLRTYDANHCYSPKGQKKTGYAVIINHEKYINEENNRPGASEDATNMTRVLRKFGFKVVVLKDKIESLLKDDIKDCVEDLSRQTYDSLIVVVGSHGDKGDVFLTRNGTWISSWKEVVEKFSCPKLEGKPKIFLFNFCRGGTYDHGVRTDTIKSDGAQTFQPLKDTLVCFSTVDRYTSLRFTDGSYFLQYIAKYFESHGRTEDICTILALVAENLKALKLTLKDKETNELVEFKQMCTYFNFGFSKTFYLG